MCNPVGCTFCALLSGFGAFFMFLLGICISNNYEFVGEWYSPPVGSPSEAQIKKGATSCFITGGIYIGFTVMAAVCVCYQNKKLKRS
ncbi:hypothetical protein HYH03_015315 [Edaphochlamys debaryana]|uniref:Uncharacterized protein n=1 Tax=Edaphochlamys debaryana TaxID=47281 RepID=A0A835XNF3_9CHLO|nr:hypothetical protein HYH03_015315 [Edaphochlamys debaryana]|eukprot:KAG2485993.1 hypothetical protein HYH03_015315 [Edaphochlamys debaryana]